MFQSPTHTLKVGLLLSLSAGRRYGTSSLFRTETHSNPEQPTRGRGNDACTAGADDDQGRLPANKSIRCHHHTTQLSRVRPRNNDYS